MPDWGAIASKLFSDFKTGAYGDEVQDYKAKKQAMQLAQNQDTRAANADTRAAAGEARAQDEFGFQKGNRPMVLKKLQQAVDSGELDIKAAKAKLDEYDAAGGAAGAAGRTVGKYNSDQASSAQAVAASKAQVNQGQQRINIDASQEKRAGEMDAIRKQAAQLQLDIDQQTKAAKIAGVNDQNDPAVKDAQELRSLVDYIKYAPSDEDAAWASDRIKQIATRNQARKLGAQGANAANPNAAPKQVPIGFRDTKSVMDQWGYK